MTRKVIGIYLAAGKSSRFGNNKLMIPFGEGTLGSTALSVATNSMLDMIIVIVRNDDKLYWLNAEISKNEKITIVRCTDYFKGQSYSLKCGLHTAKEFGADSVMILLADQPFITNNLINQLIQVHDKYKNLPFICATKKGVICPPVLINQSMFNQFEAIQGDEGARKILGRKRNHGMLIEVKNQFYLFDIDTKKDYEMAKLLLERFETK